MQRCCYEHKTMHYQVAFHFNGTTCSLGYPSRRLRFCTSIDIYHTRKQPSFWLSTISFSSVDLQVRLTQSISSIYAMITTLAVRIHGYVLLAPVIYNSARFYNGPDSLITVMTHYMCRLMRPRSISSLEHLQHFIITNSALN